MTIGHTVRSLAFLFLLPGFLLAGGLTSEVHAAQTGTISGRVTGADGTPIPGATVTLSSPQQIGTRQETTNDDGSYKFVQVVPGKFTVVVEATGFLPKVVPDVPVNLDRTSAVNVALVTPEAEGEEITITEARPTVDVTQTQGGEVVNKDFLVKLPVNQDYLSVAQMVPGVIGSGNSNVQGSASIENQFLVDGVNITDPVTSTFSANFNFESIEQVEVLTGGFDPEHQALGGVINVVTKSGGNDFHGGISQDYQDNQWSSRNGHRCAKYVDGYDPTGNDLKDEENCVDVIEFSERGARSVNYGTNLWLGGPILRDKVWFFTSYSFAQSLNKRSQAAGPRNYTGNYFQGKITYQPAPRHKFTFSMQSDPTLVTRLRQSRFVPNEAEAQQAQGGLLVATEWQWFATDRLVLRNGLNFKNDYIDVSPMGRNQGMFASFKPMFGDDSVYGDLDTPGRIGVGGSSSSENYAFYSFNRRDRVSVNPKATYYLDDMMGSHEIGVGMEVAFLSERVQSGATGNIYFVDINRPIGNPGGQTVNYYWVETSGPVEQKTSGVETAIYVQDAWKPITGLTIRGGMRFDRAALYNDSGDKVIGFDAFSPRIYAAYDLTGDGKTVIRGGYGRFIDPGKLSQSDFLNKNGEGYKLFLGEYFDMGENGAGSMYIGSNGQETTSRAPRITSPTADAIRLGIERDLLNGLAAGLTYNLKWTRHLFEDDDSNLIWNSDGSQTIGNRQGVIDNRWRIRTPASARRNYQNIEFTLRRRFADQLEVLGSYTWSRSLGTTATQYTAAMDNPVQNRYDYGYLFNDRTHAIRLSAAYDFNFGLTLGTTLNYLSGTRYERTYYNDYYRGYANRGAPRLTGGQIAGAPLWDLKLMYGPKLPGVWGKLRGEFTVLNLLNNRQIAGYQQGKYNDRGVLDPAGRQFPTSFRLGARYEF